jgi:hypothetical protein
MDYTLELRSPRPAPGQLELIPGQGDRGSLVAYVTFSISANRKRVEALAAGKGIPCPDGWDPLALTDQEEQVIYDFTDTFEFGETNPVADARRYWQNLVALGYCPA